MPCPFPPPRSRPPPSEVAPATVPAIPAAISRTQSTPRPCPAASHPALQPPPRNNSRSWLPSARSSPHRSPPPPATPPREQLPSRAIFLPSGPHSRALSPPPAHPHALPPFSASRKHVAPDHSQNVHAVCSPPRSASPPSVQTAPDHCPAPSSIPPAHPAHASPRRCAAPPPPHPHP